MHSKGVLAVLLALGWSVSAGASEDPAKSALLKQCESAQGEVKSECREVAKEMLTKEPAEERDDKTSQDVTHSSPAMNTPEEVKRDDAGREPEPAKGKKQK